MPTVSVDADNARIFVKDGSNVYTLFLKEGEFKKQRERSDGQLTDGEPMDVIGMVPFARLYQEMLNAQREFFEASERYMRLAEKIKGYEIKKLT